MRVDFVLAPALHTRPVRTGRDHIYLMYKRDLRGLSRLLPLIFCNVTCTCRNDSRQTLLTPLMLLLLGMLLMLGLMLMLGLLLLLPFSCSRIPNARLDEQGTWAT